MLAIRLESKGYQVASANTGKDGLKLACGSHFDLIILDIMMPDLDGYAICGRLREISEVPILMLSARSQREDLVQGFETGADDYLRKPFDFQELELRVRAILKRARTHPECLGVYEDGILRIDLERGHVFRCGQMVHLTPTEFRLLSYLVQNRGRVIRHTELLQEVWGEAYQDATASLSLYIRYLREKLEDDPAEPRYLRNKWGTGYWFSPAEPAPIRKDTGPLPRISLAGARSF
jgi:two-component system KDP operon response regulator KdpE